MLGVESRAAGLPTIVFPNLIVAHGEEGAPAYFYFDIRNDLIMRARSGGRLGISISQLWRIAGALFITLRSERQDLFNLALKDFLGGPERLSRTEPVKKLKQVRSIAERPVDLPDGAPVIDFGGHIPIWRLLLSFFKPYSYRALTPLPLIQRDWLHCSVDLPGYYEPIPYSNAYYRRTRKPRATIKLLKSCWLILQLALMRRSICRAYKSGKEE